MKAVRWMRGDDAAVSPVIATILMVAITVILAGVLYLMVAGLLTAPPSVRTLTATIERSHDGSKWEVTLVTVPRGLTMNETRIKIIGDDGTTNLMPTRFSSLVACSSGFTSGVCFDGDGDATVDIAERLLLVRASYPQGKVQILDESAILFTGTLGP